MAVYLSMHIIHDLRCISFSLMFAGRCSEKAVPLIFSLLPTYPQSLVNRKRHKDTKIPTHLARNNLRIFIMHLPGVLPKTTGRSIVYLICEKDESGTMLTSTVIQCCASGVNFLKKSL